MATDMTVSKTILQQLGGNRFIAMTGAKMFVGDANSLRFRIARRIVVVRLDPSDTYTVEVLNGRTGNVQAALSNVYNDQLQAVFTKLTGLDTHL
jgi:hypothetical protein